MTARPSVFDSVLGQEPAVETLTRALTVGRVHHAYRFEGLDGVGKERTAFALAQSLVCEGPGPLGCGQCSACKRAVKIAEDDPRVPAHPDVVLLERGLYPASALGTTTRENTLIGVEQIRKLVLARVGYSPHEGRALVFIVRAAEELSLPAANALLKTLEEPPNRVHFILLTSQPSRLLDTIRSRTLAVRFAPLAEPVLERILAEKGLPRELARHAGGSAGAALALSDEDEAKARSDFVAGALEALAAPSLEGAVLFASNRPDDRDRLKSHLGTLSQHFALSARDDVATDVPQAERSARRYEAVLTAISDVERNAQPGLVLESMLVRLRAI